MSHEVTRPVTEAEVRRPRWLTVEVAIVIAVGCRRCSLVPGKQTSDRVKLSKPASGERDPVGGDSSGGCNVASRMKLDVPASVTFGVGVEVLQVLLTHFRIGGQVSLKKAE